MIYGYITYLFIISVQREKSELLDNQQYLARPEELVREREALVKCRAHIVRLEMRLRTLVQKYTMLKAAMDVSSGNNRYNEGVDNKEDDVEVVISGEVVGTSEEVRISVTGT